MCTHINHVPDSNSWNRIVTEPFSSKTHPTILVWSVEMEIIDYKLNESDISLTTAATEEDTVCVLTCTLSVVARWMSALAWTSRLTTSV